MSASCTALYILVLYDYYRNCQVSGIDGLCFYGDYYIFGTFDFNSKVWPGWDHLTYLPDVLLLLLQPSVATCSMLPFNVLTSHIPACGEAPSCFGCTDMSCDFWMHACSCCQLYCLACKHQHLRVLYSQIMFAIWWLTAFWFFTWVINYGRVRNWFREVCNVGHAGNVHVWAPAEVQILTANASPLVWLVRKAKVLQNQLCHEACAQHSPRLRGKKQMSLLSVQHISCAGNCSCERRRKHDQSTHSWSSISCCLLAQSCNWASAVGRCQMSLLVVCWSALLLILSASTLCLHHDVHSVKATIMLIPPY